MGTSLPAHLIVLWREGRFDLLTSAGQPDEPNRVTRYPKIRERMPPALADRLITELRDIATVVKRLPVVTASPDPEDNYLPAMTVADLADPPPGSAERKRVCLHPRIEKADLERAVGHSAALPDKLIQPLARHRAPAIGIGVRTMAVPWRLAVDSDPKPDRAASAAGPSTRCRSRAWKR